MSRPHGDMRLAHIGPLRWGFLCRACWTWREPWWTKVGARQAAVAHWRDRHEPDAIIEDEWAA